MPSDEKQPAEDPARDAAEVTARAIAERPAKSERAVREIQGRASTRAGAKRRRDMND